MQLSIDHVVFAWDNLDRVTDRFADLGLTSTYGGAHGNGKTHMSLVCFPDGSYVELITPRDKKTPPVWSSNMTERSGPCAWCIGVDDMRGAVKNAVDAGIAVAGPWNESRHRPDEILVEWDKALLGVEQNSADQRSWLLPFFISDRTPRRRRVDHSDDELPKKIMGIGDVILAVPSLNAAIDRFKRMFQLPTPEVATIDSIDARVAEFPGTPVALATPASDGTWLADRLRSFGPGPCMYLLESDDIDAAAESYPLTDVLEWPTGRVAWFDDDELRMTLGVIELSR